MKKLEGRVTPRQPRIVIEGAVFGINDRTARCWPILEDQAASSLFIDGLRLFSGRDEHEQRTLRFLSSSACGCPDASLAGSFLGSGTQ